MLTRVSSQPYLHESRHQHAMRRARGNGGRFAKKTDVEVSKHTNKEKDTGAAVPVSLPQSVSSSGLGPVPSEVHERFEKHNYANVLQSSSAFCLHSGERVEEGDCSGQQRGSISSEQSSQRRLAIQ
ncbi:nuclear transcription factor Y subunit A-9-like [Vigna umbellata]|uniref:nuclear transcription factor Y subunit A-9-like n=1 Tax=Vigna umbellata TaxID=87088 RepID=UPI001F5E92D2|nr:nuclear transcription factor Y subunit A-9-like [Vigna umbellata]